MKRIILTITMITFTLLGCEQPAGENKLIQIAEFGNSMAIGLSVNSDNRVFVSFPNYNGDGNLALAEVIDGAMHPYPNTDWNTQGGYANHFLRIQDIYVDAADFLWVLDSRPGSAGNIFGDRQEATEGMFKLVKINTRTNQVEDIFLFEDLDKSTSALNDVRIDIEKQLAYLSDPGQAAIVVLDLQTKTSRSVLAHTEFTLADDITLAYDGVNMQNEDGKPFSSNINSIALTHDFNYFYFKPINKQNLFRIETQYLADSTLTNEQLASNVEDMGPVGITHGMIADKKGNIYFASSEEYTISYLDSTGNLHTLIEDPNLLLWPDSFGIGPDGHLYFTCAQIQRLPQWNNGKDKTDYPYRAYKLQL